MVRSKNAPHRKRVLLILFMALALPSLALSGWKVLATSEAQSKDFYRALTIHKFDDRPDAPSFSLPDTNGDKVDLADFKGKVVLLNFWATWCPPCRAEMPEMQQLHQAFKDKGFTVLAVSIDDTRGVIAPFMEGLNLTFPALHDRGLRVARRYGFRGPPLSYLIDVQGRVVGSAPGPRSWFSQDAQALIEELLSEG